MVNDVDINRIRMTGWTQLFDTTGVALEKYMSFSAYFDENDNKTEEVHYDKDGSIRIKKLFDRKGTVSEEVHYESDGSVGYKYIFTYDESGKEIERAMHSIDGSLHKKRVHEYNTRGKIDRSIWYDKDGNVEVIDEYKYKEGDGLVTITRGAVAEWTNSYDETGNLVSTSGGYWSDDQLDQTKLFYSENGLLMQKDKMDAESTIISTTTYVYTEMDGHH